jgi:hypothetical protein
MSTRRLTAIPLLIALVTISGCGAADPGVGAPSESPSASASPTPTADAADLVLTTRGLGGLVIGEAPAESDDVFFDEDYCLAIAAANGQEYPADQDPGRWIATERNVVDGERAFGVQVIDGVVSRIDLHIPGILTDLGIGVGSRSDAVETAYPTAEIVEFPVSDVVVVDGEGGTLLIEIPRGREAGYWMPDELDVVIAINASIDSFGVFSVAGTDNRAGEC